MGDEATRRNVLIPVDKSDNSERAVRWYLNNMRSKKSTIKDHLIIFHSVQFPTMPAMAIRVDGAYDANDYKEELNKEIAAIEALKQKYKKILKDETNLTVEFHVSDQNSNVGDNVCRTAKEKKVSVIVIGSRGQGKLRRTVLGSVSDYVLHHSHLPIVIIPPGAL